MKERTDERTKKGTVPIRSIQWMTELKDDPKSSSRTDRKSNERMNKPSITSPIKE